MGLPKNICTPVKDVTVENIVAIAPKGNNDRGACSSEEDLGMDFHPIRLPAPPPPGRKHSRIHSPERNG